MLRRLSVGLLASALAIAPLPTKALEITGTFYFFSHTNKLINKPSMPGTIFYLAPS